MKWTGVSEFNQGFTDYERRVNQAVFQVGQYWAAVFEAEAKDRAIWTDRTANARQSLHGFVEELAGDTVRVYLSHGMPYGIHLETMASGRWSIIYPTIERHLDDIRQMLQGIFG